MTVYAYDTGSVGRQIAVLLDDLARPGDNILHALSGRLSGNPKLQVLWAIVGLLAVLVVDRFALYQGATEHLGHDVAVFEHP